MPFAGYSWGLPVVRGGRAGLAGVISLGVVGRRLEARERVIDPFLVTGRLEDAKGEPIATLIR